MSPKGPPFNFFLFCKRMDVRKLPRAPLFHFWHYATYRRPKKSGVLVPFLGVGKIFDYLCNRAVFFSPDLFMKISNFSKTVHTIFINFCTVTLHPKGPLRAQWHQNRMAGMSETAKISPKMAKKQPFFDFRFSQKLSIRFERNFLQLFYTILESYMCNGIKIVWLGCEKQPKLAQKWSKKGHFSTSEGKIPKPTPLPHMRLWFPHAGTLEENT